VNYPFKDVSRMVLKRLVNSTTLFVQCFWFTKSNCIAALDYNSHAVFVCVCMQPAKTN